MDGCGLKENLLLTFCIFGRVSGSFSGIESFHIDMALDEWEKKQLSAGFDLLDLNSDGKIVFEELSQALAACGFRYSEQEVKDMIRVADVRGHSWEGAINKMNYLKLFTHQQVNERQDGIEEAFNFIAKGETELDREAIQKIFEALGEKTTEEEINELMDLGDLDDDGYIGLEDFMNMCNAPDPKIDV